MSINVALTTACYMYLTFQGETICTEELAAIFVRLSQRESELETKKAEVEEVKAKLMDKENKFQDIVNENERLNLKLEKCLSLKSEQELKLQRTGMELIKFCPRPRPAHRQGLLR